MRRQLLDLRKVVAPQRDLLVHGTDDILELPGLEHDSRNYFRDLYDHMLRISGQSEMISASSSPAPATPTCRWSPTASTRSASG